MWFDGKNKEQEKKQKTAVAVAYEPGDAAPKILAAGKGEVAERIAEDFRIFLFFMRADRRDSVRICRVFLAEFVTFSLFGDNMQKY